MLYINAGRRGVVLEESCPFNGVMEASTSVKNHRFVLSSSICNEHHNEYLVCFIIFSFNPLALSYIYFLIGRGVEEHIFGVDYKFCNSNMNIIIILIN